MSLFDMAGAKHLNFPHPIHLNRCAYISLCWALYVIGFYSKVLPRGVYLALLNPSKFERVDFSSAEKVLQSLSVGARGPKMYRSAVYLMVLSLNLNNRCNLSRDNI